MTDPKELRALLTKVTPGPWKAQDGMSSYPEGDDYDYWTAILSPAGREIVTLQERWSMKPDDRADYSFDAAFIAAARSAVPALLDRVEALEAELEQCALELEEAANVFSDSNMQGLRRLYQNFAVRHRALLTPSDRSAEQ